MKIFRNLLLLFLLLTLPIGAAVFGEPTPAREYWPAENWRTSTPEEQGVDSGQINSMLQYIREKKTAHSVIIIRNGFLITEAYFSPYHPGVQEDLESGTNSIISALTGIAIEKGLIKDVRQKAVDFFPMASFANPSDGKNAITIENLLTMTSGLGWPYKLDITLIKMMANSKDSVEFVFGFPMADSPGTRFNYFAGASQILSAIIREKSGKSTLDFAQENLFTPLGISSVDWPSDPRGVNWGAFGLSLSPLDMARFGYLYLRGGVWDGKQIVPAAWVADSTKEQVRWEFHPGESIGYGYHWWRESFGFSARGWGSQCIYILPKYDMVLVFTGESDDNPSKFPFTPLIEKYVIPAVTSVQPLPPNPKTAKEMKQLLQEISQPKKKPVPPLPAMAAKISGKTVQCGTNKLGLKAFSVRFDAKKNCYLTITHSSGISAEYPVGLDGVYRNTISKEFGEVAFKGAWILENTLYIDEQVLKQTERYLISFTFDKDTNVVSIDVSGSILGHFETIRGELQE